MRGLRLAVSSPSPVRSNNYDRAIEIGERRTGGVHGRRSWAHVLSPQGGEAGLGAKEEMSMRPFKHIGVDLDQDMVATIEIRRPPHNFFDIDLIREIADACEALDKDEKCRAS